MISKLFTNNSFYGPHWLLQEDGKTSIMLAAEHGFAEIIQCLLSCEPNVLFSDDHGAIAADLAKDFPDALDCLSEETMVSWFLYSRKIYLTE